MDKRIGTISNKRYGSSIGDIEEGRSHGRPFLLRTAEDESSQQKIQ